MAEIGDLVPIDDNNTARWPEGMPPSDVNNAGRADEGIMSRWHRDTNGSLTSTGTDTAYQLTTNQNLTAYYNGLEITFQAHLTCGDDPTLQLGTLGAASIVTPDDLEFKSGDIPGGAKVNVIYNGSKWVAMNVPNAGNLALLNADNTFTGVNVFNASNQRLTHTDDAVTSSPTLYLERNRSAPVTGNDLGSIFFDGADNTGANQNWGSIRAEIVDPTNGSHSGLIMFRTAANNVFGTRLDIARGLVVPNGGTDPTGGDLGFGTINTQAGVSLNGVEYSRGWQRSAENTTTGGTTISFTGLPSGLNEVVFLGKRLSLSTNFNIGMRIGDSGGFESSGYIGSTTRTNSLDATWSGEALVTANIIASGEFAPVVRLTRYEGNTWWFDGSFPYISLTTPMILSGYKTLSGELDRLQIFSTDGAGTFDVNNGCLVIYR